MPDGLVAGSEHQDDAAWDACADHARRLGGVHLGELFASDAERASGLTYDAAGLRADFSKQRLDSGALDALFALAEARDMPRAIERMFAGEAINSTEHRAAAHVALRRTTDEPFFIDGDDVMPAVDAVRVRFCAFADSVRNHAWRGFDGEPVTDVVNVGIGGSDLGPRMVCRALPASDDAPNVHFVANVDGQAIDDVLRRLRPQTTLFVITSKTFTTQETMANAHAARDWLVSAGGDDAVARHFVAVSTNAEGVAEFGIDTDNMFGFWDWVGGRYSLWSAVGLAIALRIGSQGFRALLDGARAMDEHFATAPIRQNLPVLSGLAGVWNTNFLNLPTQVIAPYAEAMSLFPGWLQQLEMESNGKSVHRDGSAVRCRTTPALWGDVGTNAQHAFFQMLHQGHEIHPVDFIVVAKPNHGRTRQHQLLLANALAQSAALAFGKSHAEVFDGLKARGMDASECEAAAPHRVFDGNRPSTTLVMPQLDARSLGALLALYEHRTYVQSIIWQINAFDQWGVELGKKLALNVLAALDGGGDVALDASTRSLIEAVDHPVFR